MKNIKRIFLIFILSLCLSLLLSMMASAEDKAPLLIDGAELLTSSEQEALLTKLEFLSEKSGLDIAIVTTDYLSVNDSALYARDLYEEYGYGQGADFSGILLFIYFDSLGGGYEIVTSGEAKSIFGENDLDRLEDAIYDYLADDYFDGAFDAFANECEYIIKYDGRLTPIWIFISLAVGALVAWLVLKSMMSKHKAVKPQKSAHNYMMRDTFRLDRSRDIYLYSHVTRVVKPQNNSSSGGGRSSSGRSYGGRSGRF